MKRNRSRTAARICLAILLMASLVPPTWADEKASADAHALVDGALGTLNNFLVDPDITWFRNRVPEAKGLFIVPGLIKAGLVFGGSGGSGVLIARGEADGIWSHPAFCSMGSGSFGLQVGVEKSELILMVMTQKGMDSMLGTSFKLGADASVAIGPVGTGAKAQTADIIAFSRGKGVFGGVALEGTLIKTRDDLNMAYYGQPVSAVDIVIRRQVENPHAEPLIVRVTEADQ